MINANLFLLAVILSSPEPPVAELPPPTDEVVYCWLSTDRDKKGNLVGFTETCNE